MRDHRDKPPRLQVKVENIPQEIKDLPQWCLWKWEWRWNKEKQEGRWTKPPYQPKGKLAESNNRNTWFPFADVVKAYTSGKWDGIGFFLTPPYIGIDLDDCITDGHPNPLASDILKRFETYSETSPSRRGIKLIGKGKVVKDHHKEGKIGLFSKTRYFAFTGHVLNGCTKIRDCQTELDELTRKEWPEDFGEPKKQKPPKSAMEDNQIIDKMLAAANGDKTLVLLNADISGYPSPSEADQALCNLIAFWTQDPNQIDRIFRTSGLYREEKWGKRQDYRNRTIQRALSTLKEKYKKPEPTTARRAPSMADLREYMDFNIDGGQFFTADEICRGLAAISREQKIAVYQYLSRLVQDKVLRKDPYKHGGYRKILKITAYDMAGEVEASQIVDIKLPLDLHNLIKIEPNHLVTIAGSTDAGKSALLYHLMRLNYRDHKIVHFSSPEWDQNAIKKRMDDVGIERPHPNVIFYPMLEGYEDLIPQEPCLVLVDYLRTNEKFNELDRQYHAILRNLKGGVAFTAIQKHIGIDKPTGGQYAIHAAHHVILLDTWKDLFVCKIFKTKNEHQLKGLYRLFNYKNLLLNPIMRDWKKGEIRWDKPRDDNDDRDDKDDK
jgi:hypothetical protein